MIRRFTFAALALAATAAVAQTTPVPPPKLLVVIAVDQFSADLFAEYRSRWTGGLKRLSEGVVFPSGYQSHAATETCPGHSTILTGDHPARTGVIANSWIDQNLTRADTTVYCAEDEARGASSKPGDYVPSPIHLRVPTLGDRMKEVNPASRVVAVAGKDRAAIMMGGHRTDQIWFLRPTDYAGFQTLDDHKGPAPAAVTRANAVIDAALARPMPEMPLSPLCATHSRAVAVGATKTIGTGRFARAAGDKKLFRASPESDAVTLSLAGDLISEMKLGKGRATDLIAVGLSATDVIGHSYGTEGSEMCLQLMTLDANLERFFAELDAARIDYAVVLTADHGGHDATERNAQNGIGEAQRIEPTLTPRDVGTIIAREQGLSAPALVGAEPSGDIWIAKSVPAEKRAAVIARAKVIYGASPQVAAIFDARDIESRTLPPFPPEAWSLADRAFASYAAGRSGELIVLLRPRVTPIARAAAERGYVATHGSPWDYDRRVPMLFWRKGMIGFEQPNTVETVDIAPTLAAMIGLRIGEGAMDGRCLDLLAGPDTLCR